jgi:hypothetical protein
MGFRLVEGCASLGHSEPCIILKTRGASQQKCLSVSSHYRKSFPCCHLKLPIFKTTGDEREARKRTSKKRSSYFSQAGTLPLPQEGKGKKLDDDIMDVDDLTLMPKPFAYLFPNTTALLCLLILLALPAGPQSEARASASVLTSTDTFQHLQQDCKKTLGLQG